jgi:hypothetical protein
MAEAGHPPPRWPTTWGTSPELIAYRAQRRQVA